MTLDEMRQKSMLELERAALSLKEEYLQLRIKKAVGQLEKLHRLKEARREIARLATICKERQNSKK